MVIAKFQSKLAAIGATEWKRGEENALLKNAGVHGVYEKPNALPVFITRASAVYLFLQSVCIYAWLLCVIMYTVRDKDWKELPASVPSIRVILYD